jgi:N-acetylmuramoyl-L-alanine amidase
MGTGKKNFNSTFARLSPVIVPLALALAIAASLSPRTAAAAGTATVRRQAAVAQFTKAEELRAALNNKPVERRSLAEYKQAVSSYKRVYLITPRAAEVPDALLAVAELYTEMGDRFGRSYYQSAVDSYQFLAREYPSSKYTQDALLRSAKLQRDQLGDSAQATKGYQEFLKKYAHSQRRREAEEALAELALLKSDDQPTPSDSAMNVAPAHEAAARDSSLQAQVRATPAGGELADSGNVPRIRRISTSATPDSARVVIDIEDSVQYTSARISNPDRIFFDLHAAKLTPEVARGTVHVTGNLLTAVRVAQNQAGVVRVVLDVTDVKDYTASLMNNPSRLVIDLYGAPPAGTGTLRAAKSVTPKAALSDDENPNTVAANSSPSNSQPAVHNAPVADSSSASKPSRSNSSKSISAKPDLVTSVSAPQPTHDGQSTLTRALGLKIGRIVIDAGHGGHDTGTIGPTGLMEKDLCLDVALRLGKIIQQRLPGADIVYTRSDDTFIPLEERTRIANEAKADLFISIHANSSQDHAARGIETYYLNLKGSADSMEVAARENAVSQQGIHELEDLVKKIARTEKIDESREFAEDIQDSLAKRIQKTSKTVKNRGVRKAPFVVLIGADMPSILTEISFLSNPSDEQLLKKPDYRQRVAEGLYQGVASYLQSMNSVTLNMPSVPAVHRATAVAAVEQSRNQQ